jgi:hypothetical protein
MSKFCNAIAAFLIALVIVGILLIVSEGESFVQLKYDVPVTNVKQNNKQEQYYQNVTTTMPNTNGSSVKQQQQLETTPQKHQEQYQNVTTTDSTTMPNKSGNHSSVKQQQQLEEPQKQEHYQNVTTTTTTDTPTTTMPNNNGNQHSSTMQQQQQLEITPPARPNVPNSHDFGICNESNNVRNRDGTATSRPFSLRPQDFVSHHHTRECSSVHDFQTAVKFGVRRWEAAQQNRSLVEKETVPSTFVPHGCDIPVLSPQKLFALMDRFSHVAILGDSLSRHLQGGIHVGLKNDFVSGAMVSSDPVRQQKCRCDGQFSEYEECRKLDPSFFHFQPTQPPLGLGLQNQSNPSSRLLLHTNETNNHRPKMDSYLSEYAWSGGPAHFNNFAHVDCSQTDSRGMLLILQGGLHFHTVALPTFNHFLPIFQHPVVTTCAKFQKLIVIWCSFNTHSPLSVKKYPHQSPQMGMLFNQQMQELFDSHGMENITMIDWMNLTKGAQTSDGVHYLTNVNFFKAQQVLLLAELMLDEGMFYASPW